MLVGTCFWSILDRVLDRISRPPKIRVSIQPYKNSYPDTLPIQNKNPYLQLFRVFRKSMKLEKLDFSGPGLPSTEPAFAMEGTCGSPPCSSFGQPSPVPLMIQPTTHLTSTAITPNYSQTVVPSHPKTRVPSNPKTRVPYSYPNRPRPSDLCNTRLAEESDKYLKRLQYRITKLQERLVRDI